MTTRPFASSDYGQAIGYSQTWVGKVANCEVPENWRSNAENAKLIADLYAVALSQPVFDTPKDLTLAFRSWVAEEDGQVWGQFTLTSDSGAEVSLETTIEALCVDDTFCCSAGETYINGACEFINEQMMHLFLF